MTDAITRGAHHIGLTVGRLEESAAFFTALPGWHEVNRIAEYPAIFVSDGSVLITLWKNRDEPPAHFDKNRNIGLHHIAFLVEREEALTQIHALLVERQALIEFAPEPVGDGPARHLMCYEPSGIRVEFIWPGA
jgi:catechol 2,3-dioxygenase-like lactoylglutathione lyase family enzyme